MDEKTVMRQCLDSIQDIVVYLDLRQDIRFVNSRGADILGSPERDILGKNFPESFIPPGAREEACAVLSKIARQGGAESEYLEFPLATYAGEKRFAWFCTPVREGPGAVSGIVCMGEDMSSLSRMKGMIEKTETRYRTIFDTTGSAMMIIEEDGTISLFNGEMIKLSGYSPEELAGKELAMDWLITEKERDRIKSIHALRLAHPDKAPRYYETEIIDRQGNLKLVGLTVDVIPGSKRCVVAATDLTAMKRTEAALRESEAKLASIIEFFPDPTFVLDLEGKVISWNRAIEQLTGMKARDMLGKGDHAYAQPFYGENRPVIADILLNPGDPAAKEAANHYSFIDYTKDEAIVEAETTFLRGGGKRSLWIKASRLYNGAKMVGVIESVRDITDRKRIEEELHESKLKYFATIEALDEMVHVVDTGLRLVLINRAFQQWSELAGVRQVTPGTVLNEVFPFLPPKVIDEYRQVIATGKIYVSEEVTNLGDREYITETRKIPVIEEGKVTLVVTVMRDITGKKREEKEKESLHIQLNHYEKMAAVGTLASGIAHEFNNLLQIMGGHAEHAFRNRTLSGAMEALAIVMNMVAKSKKIVNDLLSFSRRDAQEREVCDVTECIEAVLALTESQLEKTGIRVVRKYEKNLFAKINKAEIQQVVLNIVVNAREAMLNGGSLTISVKKTARTLSVSFADTGQGIRKEDMDRLFEPFYTTKGARGDGALAGTGLGLYVSYGIMARHGGSITAHSREGSGTAFTLEFPRYETPAQKKRRKKNEGRVSSLDVLVVDDEAAICSLFEKYIVDMGHQAASTLQGRKALALMKERVFDAVLLDFFMPGISGIELIDRMRCVSPQTKIVIVTGTLMNDYLLREVRERGVAKVLQKPCDAAQLEETLKGLSAGESVNRGGTKENGQNEPKNRPVDH